MPGYWAPVRGEHLAMNIVSIMAHQDDEMMCLGTMLRCQARGDALHFVTVTDGSQGIMGRPGLPREEGAAIRHAEMAALADDAGAGFVNLREHDEFLYDTAEVRRRLIEVIRACQADVIFTHYRHDYNLDHTTTHALARHCAMHSCLPLLATESPSLQQHPAVFQVEPVGPFDFVPSHYVDITPVLDRKTALLAHHASQEEALRQGLGVGLGEYALLTSRFRGNQTGVQHAEAFVPMDARGALKPYPVLP